MANHHLKAVSTNVNLRDPYVGLESRVIKKIFQARTLVGMLYEHMASRNADEDVLWTIQLLEETLIDARNNAYEFIGVKEVFNG